MSNDTPFDTDRGSGGETHQRVPEDGSHTHGDTAHLTTNQGIRVSDNQNSLKSGARGPTLLEDFVLREKIFHFDHERIPERIVHARGSAAHGYFELYESLSDITRADLFQRKGEKTPVFVRFSTVAGGAGSVDTPRDVRGFAVKFYTKEGNWDLVGNNIPVFFIQDAIKFPDLVHAVKMEADRAYPAGRQRARHVLGLGIADARDDAHADVGDVRPRHPALAAHDGGLRHPHLPAGQRQGQIHLRQVPLEAEARNAVDGLGRGAEAAGGRQRLSSARPLGGDRQPATSRNGNSASRSSTRSLPSAALRRARRRPSSSRRRSCRSA